MNTPRRIPPSLSRKPDGSPPAPEIPRAPVVPEALPADAPPPRRRSRWRWLLLPIALLLVPVGTVLALRWLPPPTTAFMLQSDVKPVQYQWIPAARLPETLRRAVIAAEDQKFRTHWGFDLVAIAEALEHNEKSRRVRGASTITQQTAKNLFLWPSRSYLRKGLEAGFTLLLELLWPKDRILEVYLNVAEFGPGIYGAEAAARKFFGKPAERLTPAEAAQLAAVLPSPRKYRADRPGPYVQRRTDWILAEIGEAPRYASVPEFEPMPPDEAGGDPDLAPMDETVDGGAPPAARAAPGGPIETVPQEMPPAEAPAPEEAIPTEPAPDDAPVDPSAPQDAEPAPETPQAP